MSEKALVLVVSASVVRKLLGGGRSHIFTNPVSERKRRAAAAKRRAAAKARKIAKKLEEEKRLAELTANAPTHIKFSRGRWLMGSRRGWCSGYSGRGRYGGRQTSRVGPRCGTKPIWDRKYGTMLSEITCEECKRLHAIDVEKIRSDVAKTEASLVKKLEREKAKLKEIDAGSLKLNKLKKRRRW